MKVTFKPDPNTPGNDMDVELRYEKGVVVVDIDTNGDVDVDMYGETLAVIRGGMRQEW
ncbi:hypothetical protein [Rhodococcus koreensis]